MKKRDSVTVITKDTRLVPKPLRLKFRAQSVMETATHGYVGEPGNRRLSVSPSFKIWLVPVPGAVENAAASIADFSGEIEIRNLSPEAAKLFKVDAQYLIEILKG